VGAGSWAAGIDILCISSDRQEAPTASQREKQGPRKVAVSTGAGGSKTEATRVSVLNWAVSW
jgi:hypothetical protein